MASSILTRNIGGTNDTRIVLSNSNLARLHGIATWTTLRVGMRMVFTNNAANITGTPRFCFGLCNNTSNLILDSTCDNFLGVQSFAPTLTYNGAGQKYYTTSNTYQYPCYRTGSAATTNYGVMGGVNNSYPVYLCDPAGCRQLYFLDITKGAGNFTLKGFFQTSTSSFADATEADFRSLMEATGTPTFTGHAQGTVTFSTFSEGAKPLNAVCVGWDRTAINLEICDLAVARLA